ncbi:MAG: 3-deoxy-D-manno-octulosonic acid transferase, partial [Deltaproteobacteria bacterium]|nr:3-deoxy-D-manno-octulosonic acid transferase [Deltaproteobacteria bacterium]
TSRPVWWHGASVGEIQMLVPLVRAWQESYPGTRLVVTTMTVTGRQTARQLFPEAQVVLLPLDLPWLWSLFFRHFKPALLIIAETELWPNLFNFSKRQGLPLALVNARISRKSFVNYQLFYSFTKEMFSVPDLVVVQDRVSGERFAGLGVPGERIVHSGNLKFDLLPPEESVSNIDYRGLFGESCQVVVAGSTHPGEDEMILDAWAESVAKISGTVGSVCLVLAPRHPHRFSVVAELLQARGLDYLRFSSLKPSLSTSSTTLTRIPAVLLLDTLGDLIHFYRFANVAIIGGTLIPGVGGHNPLEAAVFARAVIHGPYVANFADGFNFLDNQGGGLPVADCKELESVLCHCLRDPGFAQDEGCKAQATVELHRGAVKRTMAALRHKLPGRLPS